MNSVKNFEAHGLRSLIYCDTLLDYFLRYNQRRKFFLPAEDISSIEAHSRSWLGPLILQLANDKPFFI